VLKTLNDADDVDNDDDAADNDDDDDDDDNDASSSIRALQRQRKSLTGSGEEDKCTRTF
jgi:hypothetical protein